MSDKRAAESDDRREQDPDVIEVTNGVAIDISDDNVEMRGAADEEIREFDVVDEDTAKNMKKKGYSARGMVGSKESVHAKARAEGAKVVQIPLGTDPKAKLPGRMPTETKGAICDAITQAFDKYYPVMTAQGYTLNDVRKRIGIELKLLEIGFLPTHEGMFVLFTNPERTSNERHAMMQSIFVKHRLEKGEVDGDTATVLLGNLMGATPEKRQQVYDHLKKIQEHSRMERTKKGRRK